MLKLPSAARIVQLGLGRCLMLRYIVIEEKMPCGLTRYGIQITELESVESIVKRDITTDYATICSLHKMLARNAVTPIAFLDVLDDWL